jgi:hypothetical protein
MSLKQPLIALVAATVFSVGGLASASAQENCGRMYQRVMEAYQAQSPHYAGMLNRYNARCLSGSSMQPTGNGEPRYRYEQDRRGNDNDYDRWHRGW